MQRLALGIALAAVVVGSAGHALAQTMDERARLHFQAATSHFDAGNYEDALREFEMAYQLSSRPGLLYNLYLTHERLGATSEAIDHLERYLAAVTNDPRGPVLQLRLENLKRRLATGDPPPPPDAAVSEQDVASERGERQSAIESSSSAEDEGGGLIVPAIVAFAVAGVGAAVWATFGILALTEDGSLGDECGATMACGDDELSSLSTYNTVADVGLVVTLVGAATGAALLLFGGPSTDARALAFTPYVGPSSGGLNAQAAF